ncbi:TPA: hypothetical protein ACJCIW_004563, partial [Salmonella enterica subsp. enterica]
MIQAALRLYPPAPVLLHQLIRLFGGTVRVEPVRYEMSFRELPISVQNIAAQLLADKMPCATNTS